MDNTILKKAENQVRQQLFGGLALLVAALMIGNTLGVVWADTDLTNVSFNVNAGAFTIVNAPEGVNFPMMNYGESNSAHVGDTETDGVEITDLRGSGTEWNVAVSANNMQAGTNIISASRLKITNNGTIRNISAGDTNRVALMSGDGPLNDGGSTILNGSTQASGAFGYDNSEFLLNVTGTDAAGVYTGIATFTLT